MCFLLFIDYQKNNFNINKIDLYFGRTLQSYSIDESKINNLVGSTNKNIIQCDFSNNKDKFLCFLSWKTNENEWKNRSYYGDLTNYLDSGKICDEEKCFMVI